ncbi:MAG TPA: FtsX-like permease family protein [Ilumatobacteraceae bacterium]|nr:FtsX-like permease family protein [Ilumatobacteraceae bacterium]
MFSFSLRSIFSHKRRLISTTLSIILGVAFLAGTFVFTDSLRRTFDELFSSVYSRTDAVVRSSEKIQTQEGMNIRGRVSEQLISEVAAVPGVTAVSGSVGGYARILDSNGKPIGVDRGMPNFGMDISDSPISVWTMREGRIPTNGSEMAMDAGSQSEGDFKVGDRVTVISQSGAREFTLVGVVGFGTADSPVGSRVALFDPATAQEFVGQLGQVDSIMARGDGTISQGELASRIAKVMPSGTETLTGKAMAADQSSEVKRALSFFDTLLLVFAGVALFVGSFIIYNTFSIIVAQRKKENALLRAIGASQRQVQSEMMLEALVMGVLGSALGFLAGFGMAQLLRGMLVAFGIKLPSGGLVLLPRTVIASFVVGIVITLASAVLPSRRGGKVPPVAALRDIAVEQPSFSTKRLLSGLSLLGFSVLLVAIGLTGEIMLLGLGVALGFISLFVLGPLLARPIARVLGAPLARWRGTAGNLARENAMRNPKRTARTAASLMVGVAFVAAIAVFASSVKASVRSVFAKQFTGDFVVSTQTFGFGGLPVTLAQQINGLPGVRAATGVQLGMGNVDGSDRSFAVVDPATVATMFDLETVAGSLEALDENSILVSTKTADSSHVAMGDTVQMRLLDGHTYPLTVVGIYEKDELAGPYTVAKKFYAKGGGDQYDFSVYILLEPGADEAKVESLLSAVVAPYPTADLQSRSDYIETQAAQIDIFVNLTYGLLGLAVIIAMIGIANTLSLSVYERTHELGLLRAVGATRAQVRSMVRMESEITSLLGAVQGVVIGLVLGWAIIFALRDEGFSKMSVPVPTIVIVLIIAILCGIIAALRPARRAARLDVLGAIATE